MALPQHEADPAGDLVLLVGLNEDRQLIRVSSNVLTLASPVLSALLSPRFTEDRSLADSTRVLQMPFPEDNPEAMEWLCQALHFKKRLTDEISFPLVKDLAVLCHKYDLSRALGPWSAYWMQKWRGSVEDVDRYPQMLWVSYALDHQNSFWETSRELKRLYTSEDLVLASSELTNGILPNGVLETIKNDRDNIMLQLQTMIEDTVVSRVEKGCPRKSTHECKGQTCDVLAEAGHNLSELVRLGLWPMSRVLPHTNLSRILSQVSHINAYYMADSYQGFSGMDHHKNGCPRIDLAFKSILDKLMDDAIELHQGMCLRCVKQGKVTKEEGNCHAARVDLCTS